MQKSNSP